MFGFDWMTGCLECFADITSDNGAVKMIISSRMSFDCCAVLADGIGHSLVLLYASNFDRSQFLFVLLDHPLVLQSCHSGFALRQQIVASVAWLHFDDFAPLAEVFNVVDEQDFHVS